MKGIDTDRRFHMDFEIIDDKDVVAVRRGRKSQADPALAKALETLPKGKAIRLGALALDAKADNYKSAKSTVSANIRATAKVAGVKVAIAWSPDGVPQITVTGKVSK
jgi:hypothetical protein